jgi:mono/diheme cytochrome c family protein
MNAAAAMKARYTCLITCAVIAALALLGSAVAQQGTAANSARGKQLYYAHGCYACHGFNGETGGKRRLVGTGSAILESADAFVAFLRLRADVASMIPTSARMPSYSVRALSDADARDIYSYVRTFVLHAPDPKGIPTLQTITDSAKTPYKAAP